MFTQLFKQCLDLVGAVAFLVILTPLLLFLERRMQGVEF